MRMPARITRSFSIRGEWWSRCPASKKCTRALREQVRDLPSLSMLDGMLSDEALRSQWALGSLALPTEPVAVGSTWDSDFTSLTPGFGSMTVATHYRVESIDGDLVVIGSSGKMSLPDGAAASSPVPMQFGDITIVGSSRFDAGKGLLLGTESTTRVEMTMAIVGQEMVAEMVMTTTLEAHRRRRLALAPASPGAYQGLPESDCGSGIQLTG